MRGYHPLLDVAAGTGDVLMARLREGRANTARGAAHFLRETVGRVRAAGASGELTVRADSGRRRRRLPQAGCPLLNHHSPAAERTADRGDLRRLDADPVLAAGRPDVAETTYTPFRQPFGDGAYLVGTEIAPGRYRATSFTGSCHWKRLSKFGGDDGRDSGVIASGTAGGGSATRRPTLASRLRTAAGRRT